MSVKLKRYWYTLQPLQAKQFFWRAYRKAIKKPVATKISAYQLNTASCWISAIAKPETIVDDHATFLNSSSNISHPGIWNNPNKEKLWLYNLHYFDCPNLHLMQRWIVENPPFLGNGWEPYPLSLRVVNWCKWLFTHDTPQSITDSLYLQARYLRSKLEHHLLGNHLLANAKALIFAGCIFDSIEAKSWFKKGVAIFHREITEQTLSDGMHFELSPMYHCIVLEDLLDSINCLQTFKKIVPAVWKELAGMMLFKLGELIHPDGEISFFNDAALHIAPNLRVLKKYFDRLSLHSFKAPNKYNACGYYKLCQGHFTLIADAGEVGPSYLPAHGHADSLSFELSISKRRIIVNSGTSCYGLSKERLRQRGSAAHNTVVIDGKNSSDVWSGFRVGHRASISHCELTKTDKNISLVASHNGYATLDDGIVHTRKWCVSNKEITITDRIQGVHSHSVTQHFHFHPDVDLCHQKNSIDIIFNEKTIARMFFDEKMTLLIQESQYHPEFGVSIPNKKIVASWEGRLPASFKTILIESEAQ